jgi:hypothetical protein
MYRTCLFCNTDLGHNEAVEHFPVGRRLAFDAAKGRLWVVCRKCERWNLTPLEERWEAIEECERAFRGTRLRVSTDQIGLAKLREGLELVRIGDPQRPEMAAWRYGDQFGRRRKRKYLIVGGVAVAAATVMVAGPMLGIVGAGAISPLTNIITNGNTLYRARKMVTVPGPEGRTFRARLIDIDRTKIELLDGELALRVPVAERKQFRWRFGHERATVTLTGEDALRAAGAILPQLNSGGGSAEQVQHAVGLIEMASSPADLFLQAERDLRRASPTGWGDPRRRSAFKRVPVVTRLALEMATHEESERRALEGELYLLEEAWKQAEEVAAIADDMFLPASVDTDLARLRAARPEGEGGAS